MVIPGDAAVFAPQQGPYATRGVTAVPTRKQGARAQDSAAGELDGGTGQLDQLRPSAGDDDRR